MIWTLRRLRTVKDTIFEKGLASIFQHLCRKPILSSNQIKSMEQTITNIEQADLKNWQDSLKIAK